MTEETPPRLDPTPEQQIEDALRAQAAQGDAPEPEAEAEPAAEEPEGDRPEA